MSPGSAAAFNAQLGWYPVAKAAGYKVYVRQQGTAYGAGTDVGLLLPGSDGVVRSVVTSLPTGVTNYFAITDYDLLGNESGLSNELSLGVAAGGTPTITAQTIPSATPTRLPTATPSGTSTAQPTVTRTPTLRPTSSATATPTHQPTATPTRTSIPATGHTDYRTNPNVVACYSFEAGGFTKDSCSSNTLVNNNGVTPDTSDYQWGWQSASFLSSSAQYFSCTSGNCPGIAAIHGSAAQFSLVCWARTQAPAAPQALMSRAQLVALAKESFTFHLINQKFRIALRDASCSVRTILYGTTTPLANTWYHASAVYDGSSLKIFTNGQRENSVALSSGVCDGQADFRIGAKVPGTAEQDWMYGQLDECAVFDVGLSDQQICEICRFGIDGQHQDRGAACGNCTLP